MIFFNKKKNKKPRANFIFQVLISEEAKWNYIFSLLKEWKGGGVVWLLCHFEKDFNDLSQKMNELNIKFEERKPRFSKIVLCMVEDISMEIGQAAEVWIVEEHPLLSKSQRLAEELNIFNVAEAKVFIGLDEPLMNIFGSDRIATMFQRMGVTETELISHSMINKSIVNAQKKLEKKLTYVNQVKSSQEDWFKGNSLNER